MVDLLARTAELIGIASPSFDERAIASERESLETQGIPLEDPVSA